MELIQFCSNRVHLGDHDLGPLLDGLRTPTDYVLAGEGQSIYKACQLYLWCTSGRFGDLMRSICCVLGQSTLLSQCLSPLRYIKGFLGIFKEAWWNARGYSCNWLVSHPGRIRNNPSLFLRKPGKASAGWVTWLNYRFYLTIMWCMHNDSMKGWKWINTKI